MALTTLYTLHGLLLNQWLWLYEPIPATGLEADAGFVRTK